MIRLGGAELVKVQGVWHALLADGRSGIGRSPMDAVVDARKKDKRRGE